MNRTKLAGAGAALGLLILILDPKTAAEGASEGIRQCLSAVIPALFPFLVLTSVLSGAATSKGTGKCLSGFWGLSREGTRIFGMGLLGGYPVGAACIRQSWLAGRISRQEARRLMGICCNAGPAFLFGMGAVLFEGPGPLFWLWGIQAVSALTAGRLLPGKQAQEVPPIPLREQTGSAVAGSVRTMGMICGWIVLVRTFLAVCEKWILHALPNLVQVLVTGLTELTSGFLVLTEVGDPGLRFLLASGFLNLGGLCVALQAAGIAGSGPGLGLYVPGKLLQTGIALLLSLPAAVLLFSG